MAGSNEEVVINDKTETGDYKSQELPTIPSSYKWYHPPSHKLFLYVTFHEQESYFVHAYLQGENSCKEDESLLLPDLNLGPEVAFKKRST